MPHKMDHNEFQLDQDLIDPIKDFIKKIEEKNHIQKKQKDDLISAPEPIGKMLVKMKFVVGANMVDLIESEVVDSQIDRAIKQKLKEQQVIYNID